MLTTAVRVGLLAISAGIGALGPMAGGPSHPMVPLHVASPVPVPRILAARRALVPVPVAASIQGPASRPPGPVRHVPWLAQVITAEAGNQPLATQIAVGAVVLNRLRSSTFPHTLWGVLHQPGQFDSVSDGSWAVARPSPMAWQATALALSGADPTHGALYFYNPAAPHAAWMNTLGGCITLSALRFCIGPHTAS